MRSVLILSIAIIACTILSCTHQVTAFTTPVLLSDDILASNITISYFNDYYTPTTLIHTYKLDFSDILSYFSPFGLSISVSSDQGNRLKAVVKQPVAVQLTLDPSISADTTPWSSVINLVEYQTDNDVVCSPIVYANGAMSGLRQYSSQQWSLFSQILQSIAENSTTSSTWLDTLPPIWLRVIIPVKASSLSDPVITSISVYQWQNATVVDSTTNDNSNYNEAYFAQYGTLFPSASTASTIDATNPSSWRDVSRQLNVDIQKFDGYNLPTISITPRSKKGASQYTTITITPNSWNSQFYSTSRRAFNSTLQGVPIDCTIDYYGWSTDPNYQIQQSVLRSSGIEISLYSPYLILGVRYIDCSYVQFRPWAVDVFTFHDSIAPNMTFFSTVDSAAAAAAAFATFSADTNALANNDNANTVQQEISNSPLVHTIKKQLQTVPFSPNHQLIAQPTSQKSFLQSFFSLTNDIDISQHTSSSPFNPLANNGPVTTFSSASKSVWSKWISAINQKTVSFQTTITSSTGNVYGYQYTKHKDKFPGWAQTILIIGACMLIGLSAGFIPLFITSIKNCLDDGCCACYCCYRASSVSSATHEEKPTSGPEYEEEMVAKQRAEAAAAAAAATATTHNGPNPDEPPSQVPDMYRDPVSFNSQSYNMPSFNTQSYNSRHDLVSQQSSSALGQNGGYDEIQLTEVSSSLPKKGHVPDYRKDDEPIY